MLRPQISRNLGGLHSCSLARSDARRFSDATHGIRNYLPCTPNCSALIRVPSAQSASCFGVAFAFSETDCLRFRPRQPAAQILLRSRTLRRKPLVKLLADFAQMNQQEGRVALVKSCERLLPEDAIFLELKR